jgi:hypothetical protein|tara:strand:+ start:60 stop:233 length:174 start_codon:yes stop_codon:yes gene_type:complete
MDSHIANDPNNPINWNGENATCNCCGETLYMTDYEETCNECFQKELENIGEAENLEE